MTEQGRLHVHAPSFNELIERHIDRLEAITKSEGPAKLGPGSWSTGHEDLDSLLVGLQQSLVHLIFGMPGVGTSTLALGMARSVVRDGGSVLVLSGQSPRREVMNRVLSAEARVPIQNLRRGTMREEDWTRLATTMRRLSEWGNRFVIVYRAFADLAAALESDLFDRRWNLVVVDGVQLYTRATAPESLWAAHTRIAGDIKRKAAETGTPFVLTVSTNRRPSQRSDFGFSGPLTLPVIASSNAHAAEADVVIGVHREDMLDSESPRAGEADLLVLKNRHGPNDWIVVAFQGHYARFVDMATA